MLPLCPFIYKNKSQGRTLYTIYSSSHVWIDEKGNQKAVASYLQPNNNLNPSITLSAKFPYETPKAKDKRDGLFKMPKEA